MALVLPNYLRREISRMLLAIIILLINIVAGSLIGILQLGLDWGEALQHFTLLTIGDGIAAQLPALIVSVGAHSVYYHLIARYEANLLAPLTLMTPLATIGLGVLITHDHFDLRMGIGGGLAMLGVLIVALRRKPATELLVEREVR